MNLELLGKTMVGAAGTLALAFGGWTISQISSHEQRLTELEKHNVRIETLLDEVQREQRSISAALVRMEEKLDSLRRR